MRKHYKTIVLSDIHLGNSNSKAEEVIDFLKHNCCDNLFLNGDIIDGFSLKNNGKWTVECTKFFRRIMKMSYKDNTKIIYLRGNHDDFLDTIAPISLGFLKVKHKHIYESFGKKYYIIHGDIFDVVTTKIKWLSKLGSLGYDFILWLNKIYNSYREKRGLSYYSLSQVIKHKVKIAVSFISGFEEGLSQIAKDNKCDGVIVGHIHQPAIKMIDGVKYLNSGDWLETCSALVEEENGEWKIIYYHQENEDTICNTGHREWSLD